MKGANLSRVAWKCPSVLSWSADFRPRGSDPRWLTVFNGELYFSADGVDNTWMLKEHLADDCGGFRQSSMNPKVFYAVSESNVWNHERDYDCPFGYHWASTAEAKALFTGSVDKLGVVGEERVYHDLCGWNGYEYGGLSRKHFRFSDSRVTGAFKHVGQFDSVIINKDGTTSAPPTSDLTLSEFAGIVCVAGTPKGSDAFTYYDECRTEKNSNGGVDYSSEYDGSCWARGGRELWKTDGTQRGTVRVGDTNGGGGSGLSDSGMRGSNPRYLTVFSGALYYSATSQGHAGGTELWKTDGTEGGASRVKDIWAGNYDGDPTFLTVCGGELYFSATTSASGRELWKTDGTEAGTALVKDIRSGSSGSDVKNLVCSGGVLFFAADDGVHGEELWKSDGTSSGTVMVSDIRTGKDGSYPKYLTDYGGEVLFAADDGDLGEELWKSDGTGAARVVDLRQGTASSLPRFLTVFTSKAQGAASKLFFLATDGKDVGNIRRASGWSSASMGMQMYIYDGTKVTRALPQTFGTYDVDGDSMDADFPADFGVYKNTLYYSANFGKRDYLVPSGFIDRQLTSYERTHGHDQAVVFWDDDVALDPHHVYEVTFEVGKGDVELVGGRGGAITSSSRGPSLTVNGTLKELNYQARNVLYYPRDGESGWAEFKVTVRDLVNPGDCDEMAVCEEMVLEGTRSIWITAINDAPEVALQGAPVASGAVDQEILLPGVIVSDDDIGQGVMSVEVRVSSAYGRIKLSSRDGLSFEGEGARGQGYEASVNFHARLEDINEALRQLSYICDSAFGCEAGISDQVLIKVNDNGGTGKGGALTGEATVQVNVVSE